ncbi:14775_t:CDS:1, partial [Gigaspora margarita]
GEEKVQGLRREYAPKNKKELMKKRNQHTYLGSRKTEGDLALAKSLEAIISSLMSNLRPSYMKRFKR